MKARTSEAATTTPASMDCTIGESGNDVEYLGDGTSPYGSSPERTAMGSGAQTPVTEEGTEGLAAGEGQGVDTGPADGEQAACGGQAAAERRSVTREVVIPVPVEEVRSIEFKLPKLKVNKTQVGYPVYAPRIIEYPIPAENLSQEALSICDSIKESVDALTQPQTPATLESIADSIVESLEVMKNFL
ncbi:hypothetical protein GNI_057490 [Gregarina niphandrodes]|uniref:Uncharacterized protein n=1 Tax=Gregarina niphandrodes TaxID=110365 RepID=A0A023B8Q7_GRENI|nr:hypothetical protein GNI_057490 [Gregarina niphandrodes]EZG69604.1 hypothetical protein GNI_057490 [Gregarina niphandrodes]|eukprot:XP_011129998.1 hypothetical protein GNI_057490 [Gregarina niphandrodes]